MTYSPPDKRDQHLTDDFNSHLVLEKAHLDWQSTRTQMTFGALAIILLCFCQYASTTSVGLLLDDFNHVEYVHRAVHGDWHDFLSNFYSTWGRLDALKAYRPMVSLTFLTDHLLYRLHYGGYHVTNIVMFAASAILVSLITLELLGSVSNRTGAAPAVWAGLLFATYPLHAESVAWIIGRVDVVCGLFYFASIFCFLRYRLVKETSQAVWCVIFFVLALGSKEMAVTLPLIATLAALALPSPAHTRPGYKRQQLVLCGVLWAILIAFTLFRQAILGATIGGYGTIDKDAVLNSLKVFADKASVSKIFVPLNEELQMRYHAWTLISSLIVILVTAIWQAKASFRIYLFLLGWAALAVIPTFQIWKIYPNLVGSRLFYISSAPFCILLAIAGASALTRQRKQAATALGVVGLIALTVLFTNWAELLERDLIPWTVAGKQLQQVFQELKELTINLPSENKILLLNLPHDYKGAGLIARTQYLAQMTGLPFQKPSIADRFITDEPIIFGSQNYLWPGEFQNLLKPKVNAPFVFIWRKDRALFIPWKRSTGSDRITIHPSTSKVVFQPNTTTISSPKVWRTGSEETATVEKHDNFLRIFACPPIKNDNRSKTTITVNFPVDAIDPVKANFARLRMKIGGDDLNQAKQKCRICWTAKGDTNSGRITFDGSDTATSWLGRYRSWSYGLAPNSIGLMMPSGNYYIDLYEISIEPDKALKPELLLNGASGNPGVAKAIYAGEKTTVSWSAEGIPGAKSVQVMVSRTNLTFDPTTEMEFQLGPTESLLKRLEFSQLKGSLDLNELQLEAGTHQIRVMPLDAQNAPIGPGSEPISVQIPKLSTIKR